MADDWRPCDAYCEHGGVCELPRGHEGQHDTGYCRFTDEQAVSKLVADAELCKMPGGSDVVALSDVFRAMLGDGE